MTKLTREDKQVAKRRDEALKRALSMPPKPHKDSKKGTPKDGRDADGDQKS